MMSSIGNAATAFFFILSLGLAVNGRRGVGLAALVGWACGAATVGSAVLHLPAELDLRELTVRGLAVTGIAVALVWFDRRKSSSASRADTVWAPCVSKRRRAHACLVLDASGRCGRK
jgi:hypothetical protein